MLATCVDVLEASGGLSGHGRPGLVRGGEGVEKVSDTDSQGEARRGSPPVGTRRSQAGGRWKRCQTPSDRQNRPVRAVVQRVSEASVSVDGEVVGACGAGLAILLGIAAGDDGLAAERLAGKIARLRIFENEDGRFDRSLLDVGGEALVVSQFTLIADTRKGNRPSFTEAAPPEAAEPLYASFCAALEREGVRVGRGVFGARMEVSLVNDGPVTIVLGS
jgi:D-aminoacyl-tRNA deacylase